MAISRTTSNEREPRRFARGRSNGHGGRRMTLAGLLAAVTLTGGLAFTSEVFATQPTPPSQCEEPDAAASLDEAESAEIAPVDCLPEHKVWVCHATAGEGELKNGYNLIFVDVASTQPGGGQGENDHYGHSTTDPKVNKKFGDAKDGYILKDYILSEYTLRDEVPTSLPGKCGETPPPKVEVTPSVEYAAPTCTDEGSFELSEGEGYTWTENNGIWTAEPDDRYYFGDDAVTTFTPGDLERLTAGCETTTTPTVTNPPARIEVSSQSPLVPAQAPTTPPPAATVSAAATQLPSTGNSSWVTALIALIALAGGTGLVRLSRRTTD
jgi:LPXTG-motif cell wall-anchored protein